jgi:hypothetical protein
MAVTVISYQITCSQEKRMRRKQAGFRKGKRRT